MYETRGTKILKGDKLMALALGLDEAMELATKASADTEAAAQLRRENEALRTALVYARDNRGPSFDYDRWTEMTDKALARGEVVPGSLEDEIVLRKGVEKALGEVKGLLANSERRFERVRDERNALENSLAAAKVEMNTLSNSATEAQRRLRVVTEERDTLSKLHSVLQANYERILAELRDQVGQSKTIATMTAEIARLKAPAPAGPAADQDCWGFGYAPVANRARVLGWDGNGSLWGLCKWAGVDSKDCAGPTREAGIERAVGQVRRFVEDLEMNRKRTIEDLREALKKMTLEAQGHGARLNEATRKLAETGAELEKMSQTNLGLIRLAAKAEDRCQALRTHLRSNGGLTDAEIDSVEGAGQAGHVPESVRPFMRQRRALIDLVWKLVTRDAPKRTSGWTYEGGRLCYGHLGVTEMDEVL